MLTSSRSVGRSRWIAAALTPPEPYPRCSEAVALKMSVRRDHQPVASQSSARTRTAKRAAEPVGDLLNVFVPGTIYPVESARWVSVASS